MRQKTPTPEQLEAAAKALRAKNSVDEWRNLGSISNANIQTVCWDIGRALDSYPLIQTEVTEIVNSRLLAIVQEAVDRIDARAEAALKEIGL